MEIILLVWFLLPIVLLIMYLSAKRKIKKTNTEYSAFMQKHDAEVKEYTEKIDTLQGKLDYYSITSIEDGRERLAAIRQAITEAGKAIDNL